MADMIFNDGTVCHVPGPVAFWGMFKRVRVHVRASRTPGTRGTATNTVPKITANVCSKKGHSSEACNNMLQARKLLRKR